MGVFGGRQVPHGVWGSVMHHVRRSRFLPLCNVFSRPARGRQRVDRYCLVMVVMSAVAALSATVITPTTAVADTATGSASSASVRYIADLSPLANGGVLANTAIGAGG